MYDDSTVHTDFIRTDWWVPVWASLALTLIISVRRKLRSAYEVRAVPYPI